MPVICPGTLRTGSQPKLIFPKSMYFRPCSCFSKCHLGRPADGTSFSPPSPRPSPGTRSPRHRSVLSAPRGRYGQNRMIPIRHNGSDAVPLTDALRCLLHSLPVLSGIVLIGLQVCQRDGHKTLRNRLHLWVPHPFCFVPQLHYTTHLSKDCRIFWTISDASRMPVQRIPMQNRAFAP